jgi:hypothetical protein
MAMDKSTKSTYPTRITPTEAFLVVQLIDTGTFSGRDVEQVSSIKAKVKRILDTHWNKTQEWVGYGTPPGMPPDYIEVPDAVPKNGGVTDGVG